ncbi:hypothetical protein H0H81_001236 [Sphagnurus paluster]|uniref:Uncharacterized protein n=1 Tax=Sphagnurus paluster TaxID=117069 RepID=A0A9P7GN47_9AGAR|nr:hypothetical protein H0H81_001236 [Sphagnurus paluster]
MNFDIDFESSQSQSHVYDFPLSPTRPLEMDMVDWANSQPVALKSLLLEVTKKPEKRPIKHETTWPSYADPVAAPIPSDVIGLKSRPLRRTNSSARARLGPENTLSSANPPPVPDDSFWGKDRSMVLAACQNFSERMDENVFLNTAKAKDTAAATVGPTRRKTKPHLMGIAKSRRSSMPHTVAHASRLDKGKQRENVAVERRPASADHHIAFSPSSSASSSSSTTDRSSSFSSNQTDCMTMELDSADTSMMSVDPADLPPPPALATRSHSAPGTAENLPSRSSSTSSLSRKTSLPHRSTTTLPPPKLHPLLTQKQRAAEPSAVTIQQPQRHSPAALPERAPPPPVPSQRLAPPTLSQRPPALGMRRVQTVPAVSTSALPTRQKGFKPPLLSQPAPQGTPSKPSAPPSQKPKSNEGPTSVLAQAARYPARSTVKAPLQPQPQPRASSPPPLRKTDSSFHSADQSHNQNHSRGQPAPALRAPSPPVNLDPDSSYDISMEMNLDELEQTMRMYD